MKFERSYCIVYKIPYRRARAWPSGCIGRVRARAKESCIQVTAMRAIWEVYFLWRYKLRQFYFGGRV